MLFEGEVESLTWEQTKHIDASIKYTGPGNFPKERIPHLKEMLRECKKHGICQLNWN